MRARIGGSRLRAAFVIACFVVLVLPGSAVAHAELVRPIPADGETVTAPVTVISGRYSEDMAGNSKPQVLDQSGTNVATGGASAVSDCRTGPPSRPLGGTRLSQTPEKSGLPFGSSGAGALRFG